MNEGIYGSVKCTVATGKTTTNSSNAEKQHLCGSSSRPRASHGRLKTPHLYPSPYKTLEDEGFVNEGIYWSVKSAIATSKTTKYTKNQSSSWSYSLLASDLWFHRHSQPKPATISVSQSQKRHIILFSCSASSMYSELIAVFGTRKNYMSVYLVIA